MTDAVPLRKVIFLCAAVAATATLAGCGDPNLSKTFADIKAIKVDDSGSGKPEDRKLSQKDLELAVNTAKDLTVNKGGLLDKGNGGALPISVVDPSKMQRPDDGPPLDERVGGDDTTATVASLQPMQSRPETPPAPVAGRFIQVGSFGSAAAAKSAWAGLVERYPGVEQYSPSYQAVTLASGKSMVRLKVGPVAGDRQAQSLCSQLDIHDTWCARAG